MSFDVSLVVYFVSAKVYVNIFFVCVKVLEI